MQWWGQILGRLSAAPDPGNDGGGDRGDGGGDPRNPEWEAFQGITSGFPVAGIGVSLIGAAIDGGQLGLAIARGDWADVRDEVGDITGSLVGAAVGFMPGANLVSGVVGAAVGRGVTSALDGLFG